MGSGEEGVREKFELLISDGIAQTSATQPTTPAGLRAALLVQTKLELPDHLPPKCTSKTMETVTQEAAR